MRPSLHLLADMAHGLPPMTTRRSGLIYTPAGTQLRRPGDTWIVLPLGVPYQRVDGPATTQPASVGLTQKPNDTSITCARWVTST
ncbi:hypothetical protein GCM10023334_113930 [Nonomuraea thailandensis]